MGLRRGGKESRGAPNGQLLSGLCVGKCVHGRIKIGLGSAPPARSPGGVGWRCAERRASGQAGMGRNKGQRGCMKCEITPALEQGQCPGWHKCLPAGALAQGLVQPRQRLGAEQGGHLSCAASVRLAFCK